MCWKEDLNCTSGTKFPSTRASFLLCQKKKKIKSAHCKADQSCLCWQFCRHLYFAYPIHFNVSNFLPVLPAPNEISFAAFSLGFALRHQPFRQQNATQPTKIIKPKKSQTLINSNMKSNSAAVMSQYRAARTHHAELHRWDGEREQEAPSWKCVNWIPSWNCDRCEVIFNLQSISIELISALCVNNRNISAQLWRNE